ncbi:MAG: LEA type 2 family protein [Desulfobacteraceae bacterium]|nr:LEA type 2 family protein [Desulfobacteraceae bacterium]
MIPKKKPWSHIFLMASLAFLLLCGCASLKSRTEPPRVNLASMRVKQIRGLEAAFEVDLRVLNRSEKPLMIQGVDCDLAFNNRQFAQGVAGKQQQIPPYESKIVTLTVYSSMLNMVNVVQRLIKQPDKASKVEKWSYALKGHVRAGSQASSYKIPINSKGEINLKAITAPDGY